MCLCLCGNVLKSVHNNRFESSKLIKNCIACSAKIVCNKTLNNVNLIKDLCLYVCHNICEHSLYGKLKLCNKSKNLLHCVGTEVIDHFLDSCYLCKELCLCFYTNLLDRCDHLLKNLNLFKKCFSCLSVHIIYNTLKPFKLCRQSSINKSLKLSNSALEILKCLSYLIITDLIVGYLIYNLIKKLNSLVECRGELANDHIVNTVILNNRLDINCDNIPNKISVDIVPFNESRNDYVSVVNYKLYCFITVLCAGISDNCDHIRSVFGEEINNFIVIRSQELNYCFRVVNKPVIAVNGSLVTLELDQGNDVLYKIIINLGSRLNQIKIELNDVVVLLDRNLLKLLCENLCLYKKISVNLLKTCNQLSSMIVCNDIKCYCEILKRLNVKK